jgi:IclR family transcriptional regulator, acetate operon repressor
VLLQRTGMAAHTVNTITDPVAFAKAMTAIREVGYALDEGEQEIGVRCVAVAVPGAPAPLALSVSGPAARMTDSVIKKMVPLLQSAAKGLADDLTT